MCQLEICPCQPVQSGRNGPRISVVIDRRTRPWAGVPRERRMTDTAVIEDRRIAERNRRECEEAEAGVPTWVAGEEQDNPAAP